MKKAILIAMTSLVGTCAFAGTSPVEKAAAKLKDKDTRTVTTEVENTDGNPCMPEGKSYQVDLQVKKAYFNAMQMRTVYSWETVKTINVSKDGRVMEVCAE